MKRTAILLCSIIAVLSLAGSLQAGVLGRVEAVRRQNEIRIERQAAMQHRATPLLDVVTHVKIELREAAKKAQNNIAAKQALVRSSLRVAPRFSTLRYDRKYGRRALQHRGVTCKPVRGKRIRW